MEDKKNDNQEIMLFQHPTLPEQWDYADSVKSAQRLYYKMKNITRDFANVLWVARENLNAEFQKFQKRGGANAPPPTWSQYCDDIGIAKSTANRWLNKWFPERLDLEIKPTVENASFEQWIPDQDEADLLLTDPPYSTDLDDVYSFADSWLPLAFEKLKPTARAYICIGAYPDELHAYLSAAKTLPFNLSNILVWTYQNTLGPSPTHNYKLNWQAILYFVGPDAPPINCKQMVEQFSVMPISAPDGRQGDRYHEWQKPLELAVRFVSHASKEGDLIIDPFAGTGTFVLAANKHGRIGKGCDIDGTALDIAQKRGCEIV